MKKVRFSALLLAAGMLIISLAACGSKKEPEKEDYTAAESMTEQDEFVKDDLGDVNTNGFELVIMNYTDATHPYSLKTVVIDQIEDATDIVKSAIYDRNNQIEQRFSCLISEKQYDRPYDRIKEDVLVGQTEYDVALIYEEHINRCLVADALRLFEEIPNINLEKPYWNESAKDIYSYQGHVYAGVGDWCISMYSKLHAYLLNKNVYARVNQDTSIYDLVRQKQWTMEKMFEIAKDYKMENDNEELATYGIVGTSKVHFQLLLTGAGIKYIDKNDKGDYEFALKGKRASDIIDKMLTLSKQGYYNNCPETHNGGVNAKEFIEDRALLLAGMVTTINTIADDCPNCGVLPAPMYDAATQDDYQTIAVGGLLTCFPSASNKERLENTGLIIEALSCASHNEVLPVYQDKLLKLRRANSPDDADMMDIMFRTMSFDLGCSTWANDIRLPIMANVFHPLNTNYTSYLTQLSDTIVEKLSDTQNAILSRSLLIHAE